MYSYKTTTQVLWQQSRIDAWTEDWQRDREVQAMLNYTASDVIKPSLGGDYKILNYPYRLPPTA